MKLAFLVEARWDFEVLKLLVERILGCEIVPVYRERLPTGVTGVVKNLAAVADEAWQNDTDGLVVVIDNDGKRPIHDSAHTGSLEELMQSGCNYCMLVCLLPALPETTRRPPLKFAVGVAVEALEAWLLFGAHLAAEPEKLDTKVLKKMLYGEEHLLWWKRVNICKPIAQKVDLSELSQACPSFSFFAENVRQLKA